MAYIGTPANIWNVGSNLEYNGVESAYRDFSKEIYMYDDFISNFSSSAYNWKSLVGATGSIIMNESALITNTHPGIASLHTGVSAFASAALELGSDSSANAIIFGAGRWVISFIAKLVTLSSSTTRYTATMGFGNNGGTYSTGVSFAYQDNVNSGNWQLIASTNSTATTTNSSTAADTNWHIFTIDINAAGTLATFYIDNISIGTVASNIPTATFACGPNINIVNQSNSGAADSIFILDAFQLYGNLTTTR